MLISTCTREYTKPFGLIDGLQMLVDGGFKALDLTLYGREFIELLDEDHFDQTVSSLQEFAKRNNIVFNQAHAPFDKPLEGYTNEVIPRFPKYFKLCGLLGVKNLVIHPKRDGVYKGQEQYLFDLNVDFFRSLAPLAKENGIKIAIENMYQRDDLNNNFPDICGIPEVHRDLFDKLDDSEAFTLCLDTGHCALSGFDPADAIRILGSDRLGALHLQDVNLKNDTHNLPGLEKLDFDSICKALVEIGYRGDFTLEALKFISHMKVELRPYGAKFMFDVASYFVNLMNNMK